MDCDLCDAYEQKWRLVKETKYSFATICKWPLKPGHIIVLPKRHVTQVEMDLLSNEELRDFTQLVQEMENLLNEKFDENCITFKNSGKHSTQAHLHYHLLPSKGSLRDLFSEFEEISKREEISEEEYTKQRDFIIN